MAPVTAVPSAAATRVAGRLPASGVVAVRELVAAATAADGVAPLSEHVSLHLRYGGQGPDANVLRHDGDGVLVGYAHVDPTDAVAGSRAELVVHPDHRGRGHGRALVEAALAIPPDGRLRLWAHGDRPAARALAVSMGFREQRRLEQWERPLDTPLPAVELPDGVTLRGFRPGTDDAAWLELNARAFADHPEQGSWTANDLAARIAEDWFDPAGFLLAQDRDGALVAFHWTKVHGGEGSHGHDPIGEVYVVGVHPDAQGRGLGRAVTLAGLHRLRDAGLGAAMLYVEGDNTAARATYRRLGFTHRDTDVMFLRQPGDGDRPGRPTR